MHLPSRVLPLLLCTFTLPLAAQLPFYADDPSVTERGEVAL